MADSKGFSEVSKAFNEHIANLNEARKVFQADLETLNGLVYERLRDVSSREVEGPQKVRFSSPEDTSTQREVAWLNMVISSRLSIDIKQPGYKVFRNAAAYLYFESRFDYEKQHFVFQARFENQNTVADDLDEKIDSAIRSNASGMFSDSEVVKANTVILFKKELDDGLRDIMDGAIDAAIQVVRDVIHDKFPDDQYELQETAAEA